MKVKLCRNCPSMKNMIFEQFIINHLIFLHNHREEIILKAHENICREDVLIVGCTKKDYTLMCCEDMRGISVLKVGDVIKPNWRDKQQNVKHQKLT